MKVFPVTLPSLRDRINDVPMLVDHFIRFFARKMGKKYEDLKISTSAMQSYSWPGNVRELKHVVEGTIIATAGNRLESNLPTMPDSSTAALMSFEELERKYLIKVLDNTKWKVEGDNSASTILRMPPSPCDPA